MVAKKKSKINVGDRVRLMSVPDWLLIDLPEDEQLEILSFLGKIARVDKIDDYGYVWLGFGKTVQFEESSAYSGHSFCVPKESVEIYVPKE